MLNLADLSKFFYEICNVNFLSNQNEIKQGK